MKASPSPSRMLRFGVFEADLKEAELRRSGLHQKLGPQPFEVLRAMLERRGELITRDELRERLWPADTFVDYQLGLKKVRESNSRGAGRFRGSSPFHRDGPAARSAGAAAEPDVSAELSVPPDSIRPNESGCTCKPHASEWGAP